MLKASTVPRLWWTGKAEIGGGGMVLNNKVTKLMKKKTNRKCELGQNNKISRSADGMACQWRPFRNC